MVKVDSCGFSCEPVAHAVYADNRKVEFGERAFKLRPNITVTGRDLILSTADLVSGVQATVSVSDDALPFQAGCAISPSCAEKVLRDLFLDRPIVKRVLFNGPATVVFWEDGGKTVAMCGEGESFDPEKGVMAAILKRIYAKDREAVKAALGKAVKAYHKGKREDAAEAQG